MTHIHLIKTKSNLTDEYQLNLWYNRYIKLLKYAETRDFSYLALPRKIQFNLCRSLDVVNNKIPTMDSYLYKHSNKLDEPRKIMIEQHGGKTLKDLGLQVFYFYDPNFKFDFTKQFYDYENRNKHKHY